jgi:hypothetical protein
MDHIYRGHFKHTRVPVDCPGIAVSPGSPLRDWIHANVSRSNVARLELHNRFVILIARDPKQEKLSIQGLGASGNVVASSPCRW